MHKPDFIIIGAMKSATSTLQKQLSLQPGIFMTTPKEPNFFSDDEIFAKGKKWYSQLFDDAKAGDIKGEASTHYSKLPTYPETINRILDYCSKETQIIYVMRNPIDRLISHYLHEWSTRKISCDINEAIVRFPELVAYSKYNYQISPYLDAFGKERVLPIFYERFVEHPEEQLFRAARFTGHTGPVRWMKDCAKENASTDRFRKFPGYQLLIEHPLSAFLRRALVPKSLRATIRKSLSMQERPNLNNPTLAKIKADIDEDLAELGKKLGKHINCDTFNQLSEEPERGWI